MKRTSLLIGLSLLTALAVAQCPSLPGPAYTNLTYNVGCRPWPLEYSSTYFGDTTNATVQWYRYTQAQGKANAVPFTGEGSNYIQGCRPATDELNSVYYYYCVVTKPGCNPVESSVWDVHVGINGNPCYTFAGRSITISSDKSKYDEGNTITLTATTNAYGGDHIYTWYHNGVALDTTDTHYQFIWGFNQPQLVITNCTEDDGGSYSVMMQDGTECFLFTQPMRVQVGNVQCGDIPELSIQSSTLGTGDTAVIYLTKATLSEGETGKFVLMHQPEGSHPIIKNYSGNIWILIPDVAGTYSIKYAIDNPNHATCVRESSTENISVWSCGLQPTITTDETEVETGTVVVFSTTGLSDGETGEIKYSKDGGVWTALYPAGTQMKLSYAGSYQFKYIIKGATEACNRESDPITVVAYKCSSGGYTYLNFTSPVKVGNTIDLKAGYIGSGEKGVVTYTLNGGSQVDTISDPSNFTPQVPGTYLITLTISNALTDKCTPRSTSKTLIVEPCGTVATLSTDKSVLKLGESASLTYPTTQSGEIISLTYSKDGGAALPLSGAVFSPNETGQYVITCSITVTGCGTTSAQVTIDVYDCGPQTTISVPQNVQVGKPVTITVSLPGENETGTLTCSKNSGVPDTIQSGIWTPLEEGTYQLVWSIQHSKIDCSRSDTATVNVFDCGISAQIEADQTTLRLGQTVTFTLSPVETGSVGAVHYTLNGGSPISFTGTCFTPTEVGQYLFTYVVENTAIGCQTEDADTIDVYDCGPEATIEVSASEVQLLRSITISVSEVGEHETGILTYSLNGAAPVDIQPGEWQAQELGIYIFSWTVTHNKIDCARSTSATVTAIEAELVFDNNNGTGKWSDPLNWWPTYQRLPNAQDSAVLRQPCLVDITTAQTSDLTMAVQSTPALTILPTGALKVHHLLINTQAGDILVRADATGNGALFLSEQNSNIPATVEFYARSKDISSLAPTWQYMGYPLQDQPLAQVAYPQSVLYQWTNTPNTKTGGNWMLLDSTQAQLAAFTGYCMSEDKEKTYTLSGLLNDPVLTSVALPYNDQGTYAGFAFVANSWVAPIDIASMQVSDFGAADATIYIMNTGTYADAKAEQGNVATGTGAARGQYNAIPVHAAPYLPGALTVIPPMQGFFVHTTSATTLTLDYPTAVFAPAAGTMPTRSPMRTNSTIIVPEVYRFFVSGFGAEDEIYILTNDAYTACFDNGWDGYKALSEHSALHMAVESEGEQYAVAALPEINGTEFIIDGSNHKTYTLHIECPDHAADLQLWDMTSNTYIPMLNGGEYTYKGGATPERFRIVGTTPSAKDSDESAEKFIYNDVLYIQRGTLLYDVLGRKLSVVCCYPPKNLTTSN